MIVRFKLLRDDAILPYRGHENDVGLDCPVPQDGVLKPGPNKIPLGWSCEIPVGYMGTMFPRSGMASGEKTLSMKVTSGRDGFCVKELFDNGIGLTAELPPIDPGYTGEVHMIVTNHSGYAVAYKRGTKFGQLLVMPIIYAIPTLATPDKVRGSNGFGSTGI